MRQIFILICCCVFSVVGYAQSLIQVSDMGYDRRTNEFHVTLDNFTPYVLWIYLHTTDIMDSFISQNKDYAEGLHIDFCVRDRTGKKLSEGRRWLSKRRGGVILYPYCGEYLSPKKDRTFVDYVGEMPPTACFIEVTLYVKLYRINVSRDSFYEETMSGVYPLSGEGSTKLHARGAEKRGKTNLFPLESVNISTVFSFLK